MSNIHYFQRYSQKENIVTNNTMLLFSRLYHYDTTRFNRFLQTLLQDSGENFDAAIQLRQQKRVKHSIPDAVIEQPSIKIIIETKIYGQENLKQLKNHCKSFKNEDLQILLLIGHEPIDDSYRRNVVQLLNDINSNREKKISFAAITFKDICKNFNEVLMILIKRCMPSLLIMNRFVWKKNLSIIRRQKCVPCLWVIPYNKTYNIIYIMHRQAEAIKLTNI